MYHEIQWLTSNECTCTKRLSSTKCPYLPQMCVYINVHVSEQAVNKLCHWSAQVLGNLVHFLSREQTNLFNLNEFVELVNLGNTWTLVLTNCMSLTTSCLLITSCLSLWKVHLYHKIVWNSSETSRINVSKLSSLGPGCCKISSDDVVV